MQDKEPNGPQKQIADISAEGHVDSTYRKNNAELQVTDEVQNKEPNWPQKRIADIPAEWHVDSTDRQLQFTNTVQSNVEAPHVPQIQISADGNTDSTDLNEEQLQVRYEVQTKDNTKTPTLPVAVRETVLLNNITDVIEISPQADEQHTVQRGRKGVRNRSVCAVKPVKPASTPDDGECL